MKLSDGDIALGASAFRGKIGGNLASKDKAFYSGNVTWNPLIRTAC